MKNRDSPAMLESMQMRTYSKSGSSVEFARDDLDGRQSGYLAARGCGFPLPFQHQNPRCALRCGT
jgi:hypothetical protein